MPHPSNVRPVKSDGAAANAKLIPVIDLMRGEVVHAVRGQRSTYRPVSSVLCEGSAPLTVAQALLKHCAATQLYVADLDAITGGKVQVAALRLLLQSLPNTELWLDAGFAQAADVTALRAALGALAQRLVPVFGSESLSTLDALSTTPGCALSLDRRDGQRMDPAGCWDAPALWPQRVIVMTLERVGANSGPDLDTLQEVRAQRPDVWLVGSGGVRHQADLASAHGAGAQAWLVASALHNGSLPALASQLPGGV
jgi:HisA/HisF family protein